MLITARELSKSYGPRQLFQGITLGIDAGQRAGLIGANGSGKSTLLKIFAGEEEPDTGEVLRRRGLRVGYVPQSDSFEPGITCAGAVAAALMTAGGTGAALDEHDADEQARQALYRAEFLDVDQTAATLSGGWKKRLAIVCCLAAKPDLVLMDEPTNHLDIEGIEWLEEQLDRPGLATLVVSHDRRFLEGFATRIIELSRAYPEGYLGTEGAYSDFIEKREEFMVAQKSREQALASGVRREIEWLRRGAKARTTKAKGRIDRAHDMIAELADLSDRNQVQSAAQIDFTSSQRKTRKLVELKKATKAHGGRKLFGPLSLAVGPGDRLGLLGPNGSGKTTLLRLLSLQEGPDTGEVVRAEQLKVVHFDQHRKQLDPGLSLRRSLAPSGDSVRFKDEQIHVSGWARRFLFRSEQLDLPVSELSGGEQARLLIAQLMLQPADVLILDEPTNDLDIPTLDLLEQSLADFPGAVVLVTHDRYMLARISTELLALDGEGNASIFAELQQWERHRASAKKVDKVASREAARPAAPTPVKSSTPTPKKRLNWNEQKELDGMETAIARAEADVEKYQEAASDPAVMADRGKMHDACERLGKAQQEVERLYARWAELEAK
jgi:ABC transport system ATP-binding/permease protein